MYPYSRRTLDWVASMAAPGALEPCALHPEMDGGRTPCAKAGNANNSNTASGSQVRRRMIILGNDPTLLDAGDFTWDSWPMSLVLLRADLSGVVIGDQFLPVGCEAVQTPQIGGDSAIEPVGDPLALDWLAQQALVVRIAHEGDFRKHGRHVRADQHHEGSFLHASVSFLVAHELQPLAQRILDISRKFLGFLHLLVPRNFLDQIL